jgi:hypothetical protein
MNNFCHTTSARGSVSPSGRTCHLTYQTTQSIFLQRVIQIENAGKEEEMYPSQSQEQVQQPS